MTPHRSAEGNSCVGNKLRGDGNVHRNIASDAFNNNIVATGNPSLKRKRTAAKTIMIRKIAQVILSGSPSSVRRPETKAISKTSIVAKKKAKTIKHKSSTIGASLKSKYYLRNKRKRPSCSIKKSPPKVPFSKNTSDAHIVLAESPSPKRKRIAMKTIMRRKVARVILSGNPSPRNSAKTKSVAKKKHAHVNYESSTMVTPIKKNSGRASNVFKKGPLPVPGQLNGTNLLHNDVNNVNRNKNISTNTNQSFIEKNDATISNAMIPEQSGMKSDASIATIVPSQSTNPRRKRAAMKTLFRRSLSSNTKPTQSFVEKRDNMPTTTAMVPEQSGMNSDALTDTITPSRSANLRRKRAAMKTVFRHKLASSASLAHSFVEKRDNMPTTTAMVPEQSKMNSDALAAIITPSRSANPRRKRSAMKTISQRKLASNAILTQSFVKKKNKSIANATVPCRSGMNSDAFTASTTPSRSANLRRKRSAMKTISQRKLASNANLTQSFVKKKNKSIANATIPCRSGMNSDACTASITPSRSSSPRRKRAAMKTIFRRKIAFSTKLVQPFVEKKDSTPTTTATFRKPSEMNSGAFNVTVTPSWSPSPRRKRSAMKTIFGRRLNL